MREIVRLGLRADRERGDPSLGMGLTLQDAKALRNAAGRRINFSSSSDGGVNITDGDRGQNMAFRRVSPEEALLTRVQAEVVKEEKVRGGAGRVQGGIVCFSQFYCGFLLRWGFFFNRMERR